MSKTQKKAEIHANCVRDFIAQMKLRRIRCMYFEGIPSLRNMKQPDLLIPSYKVLVEIKTLQPEPEDEKILADINRQIKKGGLASYSHPDYYERHLRLISAARKQFRPHKGFKSLVVVYDMFDFFLKQDPQILMEGMQKIIVRVSRDPRHKSYVSSVEYDHKPFRGNLNTEIGAVAFRKRQGDGFIVYQNILADRSRTLGTSLFTNEDTLIDWPRRL